MNYTLKDLIDVQQFQMLQDRLNEIYSFPSAIIDNDGTILTASAWQDVCTKFHRTNKDCEMECIKSDRYIKDHLSEANPAVSYHCPHGLVDNATPIIIEGIQYGNFFTGQFFLEQPDLDFFRTQAKQFGFDEKAYIEAVKKVPIWSLQQLNSYLFFIKGLIEVISGMGLKNLKEIENRKKIQENDERYRTMLQTTLDGFWMVDAKGNLLQVNEVYCRMSGYSEQELLTMSISDLEAGESVENTSSHIDKIISQGEDRFESRHRHKDGSLFDVEVNVQYRTYDGGRFVVFLQDITERKRMEEALKMNEERWNLALESVGDGVWDWNTQTNKVFFSKQWKAMLGYSDDEVGNTVDEWSKRIHPDDEKQVYDDLNKYFNKETTVYQNEHRVLCKDGTYKWVHDRGKVLQWTSDGKPLRVIGTHKDISERRIIEEKMRESEKKLNKAQHYSHVGSWTWNIKTNQLDWSDEMFHIFGIQKETFSGLLVDVINKAIHPEDRSKVDESNRSVIRDNKPIPLEYRIIWPDQSIHTVWAEAGEILFDEDGKPLILSGVVQDITDRKKAEMRLKENQRFLSEIIENNGALIYVKDRDGKYELVNKKWEDSTGLQREFVIGKTDAEVFPEEMGIKFRATDVRVMELGEVVEIEEQLKNASVEKYFLSIKFPLRDSKNDVRGICGISTDISERKHSEIELRNRTRELSALLKASQSLSSSLNLQTVLQTTTDSIVEMMDIQSAAIYLNDGELLYLGATAPALPPNFPEELRRARLADHPHIQKAITESRPVFIPDTLIADLTPAEKAVSVQRGLRSIFYLPLLAKEQVIGILIVANVGEPRNFTLSEIDLCSTLASLAALAVENSKLYEQARTEISDRKMAELLLEQEKERLSVTLRSIGDGVITTNVDGNITMLNKAAEELTGWKTEEAVGHPLLEVFVIINEQTRELCKNPVEKVLQSGKIIELENHTALISKNGSEIIIADSGAPIRDKESRITGVVLVFRDMTEKQKLNESMQRAQKMESVALLAGGIAHDFNNLLGGVFGYLEMAKDNLAVQKLDTLSVNLNKATKVYDRAKALTRQLLTFSKGGRPIRKTQHLAPIITHSTNFALSGSNVTAQLIIADDLWLCDCDENQIGQVIDNIVINAKQSMPLGGRIIVTAENVSDQTGHPGHYVRVSVKDFGIGMPSEILLKIFDPFFSTKETGHGLGLATVFSIIKHHDGWIDVESKPGQGSTFHVFIPASQKSTNGVITTNNLEHKGIGSVLLMDDEEFMLEVVGQMLEEMGYSVVCTKDGKEAIAHYIRAEDSDQPFAACIFDLTIPGGIGGKETAAAIRDINPNSIIIASSGYSEDVIMSNPTEHKFTDKIIKPYRKNELSELLNKVLKK